jgi:hypothetical protein
MSSDNRIASLSITPTVPRQTPRNEFGAVLARTANEAVKNGAGLVSSMVPGGPALSAAVSSARSTVSSVASGATSTVPSGGVSGVGGAAGSAGSAGALGKGEQWDLLEAQKMMQAEGQAFNAAYLQLQNEMQRESREHNAVSNIMKVRHDSAKAAINNIR